MIFRLSMTFSTISRACDSLVCQGYWLLGPSQCLSRERNRAFFISPEFSTAAHNQSPSSTRKSQNEVCFCLREARDAGIFSARER